MARDYPSFLASFSARLNKLPSHPPPLNNILAEEILSFDFKANPLTKLIIRLAVLIGMDLLPERVRESYATQLENMKGRKMEKYLLDGLLWSIYPFLPWISLRGVMTLLLILEPDLRNVMEV
jgi:uncharacterized protein (DUF2236 family)